METAPEQSADTLIKKCTDPRKLNVYSLVLSAAGITHRIQYISHEHIEIYVTGRSVEKALYELASYDQENKNWPPPHSVDTFSPTFLAMSPLVVGCLACIFGLSGEWRPDSNLFAKGAGDSTAILHNLEIYRLVTPLTLHADLVHLMSNCILGGFLLHCFFLVTGNGIGLCAMLLTAALANMINVAVHGPGHLFVGFSTAVFAVIGMLCTMNFTKKSRRFNLQFFMPVMSGLALLAFLGSSGERTDLGAHLFGLLCGLVSGNIVNFSWFYSLRSSIFVQSLLSVLAFAFVLGCWLLALYG